MPQPKQAHSHPTGLGDLSSEEFRLRLHEVADWIADYRAQLEDYRVTPDVRPGELTSALPPHPPAQPESLTDIFSDLDSLIVPALVHWGHPSFLGYFGSTTTAPGILGEMIAAALNVSAMTWRTSPAATELETVVLRWIREMIGLPAEMTGIVYDTASVGTMHALAAARESVNLNIRRQGLCGRAELPRFCIYTSDQAHSSVEKAAITIGIGEENVRRIKSDEHYRLDVTALRHAIEEDVALGLKPMAVVATVGTTSTASVDPIKEIAALCRERQIWLHVDAAYGGAMAVLEEGRWVMDGVEQADSMVVNPHKWLFVPLDFSALYTRRPEQLRAVFSLTPEYLRGDAEQAEINFMDYGIQLGRRFRALKAWMVFRTFGVEGIAARIREHCRLARLFASWITADDNYELLAPVEMAVVCFRTIGNHQSPDTLNELNRLLLERINETGRVYLTRTVLRAQTSLRLGLGNVLTTEQHLRDCWELIQITATALRKER